MLFFFISCGISLLAQEDISKEKYLIDSLNLDRWKESDKKLLDSIMSNYHRIEVDTVRINLLMHLSKNLISRRYLDYVDILLEKSKQSLNQPDLTQQERFFYQKKIAEAYGMKGDYYQFDYDRSRKYYIEAFGATRKLEGVNKLKMAVSILNKYVELLSDNMLSEKALNIDLKLKDCVEFLGDTNILIGYYLNEGNIYFRLNKKKETIKCYQLSRDYSLATNNHKKLYKSYRNLGSYYYQTGIFDKALHYYLKADSISEYFDYRKDPTEINTGILYIDLKEYDKALEHFKRMHEIGVNQENREMISSSMLGVSIVYYETKKLDSAEHYAQKVYNLTREHANNKAFSNACWILWKIYEEKEQWKNAYFYGIKHSEINVKFAIKNNRSYIKGLIANHNLEKKHLKLQRKQELQKLVNEKEQEKKMVIIYSIAVLLLIVIVFMIYLRKKLKIIQKNNQVIKEYSDGLEVKSKQLEEANHQIELRSKYKEEFLANMSHEIRTPLNAIVGYANMMLNYPLFGNQKRYAKTIIDASDNLMILINDILDYSKMEAGKIKLEKYPFDLRDTLNKVYLILKLSARKKDLKLTLQIEDTVPKRVIGDSLRLQQILINLLNNAIKYTDAGEVSLVVSLEERSNHESFIRFSVKDTGIGIPRDKQQLIFDKFNQLNKRTSRLYGGTGLGLTICDQLVKLHGGRLMLKSEERVGSMFYFILNYKLANVDNQKEDAPIENKKTVDDNKEVLGRILVADDNEINRRMVVDLFENWNNKIQVDEVANGSEAIVKLKENDYDVVLMDVHMPQMDGIETTKYIRNTLEKDIIIIALTASVLPSVRKKCIDVGMNDFIMKPFRQNDLLLVLSNYFNIAYEEKKQGVNDHYGSTIPEYHHFNPSQIMEVSKIPEDALKMTKLLLTDIDECIANRNKELISKDWKLLYEISHRITNNVIYLGNKELIEACTAVEVVFKENLETAVDLKPFTELWEKIKVEMLHFCESLDDQISNVG